MRLNEVAKWRRLMGSWLGGWGARLLNADIGTQPSSPLNGNPHANDAGVNFSDARALQVSTFWSCVRLLAETIASMPLILYKRLPDGSRARATDHPVYRLLHDAPNPHMTGMEFREALSTQLVIYGNAYAQIIRNGAGGLVAMYPLRADRMTVIRRPDGSAVYIYTVTVETTYLVQAGVPASTYANAVDNRGPVPVAPVTVAMSEESVFHLKGFGADGYVGFNTLAYASNAVGLAVAAERYAGMFYAKGGKPSGVLMLDRLLSKEQREQVRREFGGMSYSETSATPLWILEASMKYQPISVAPGEAQLAESRQYQAVELARFFRVPPHLIFEMEKATTWGTGLEQQNLGFLTYSLMPYLRRWETVCDKFLLNDEERKTLYCEHLLDALLRADSAARAVLYSKYAESGIMTRDEIRRAENLPAKGGAANDLTVMSNLIPLDKVHENSALRSTPAPTPSTG